MSHDHPSGPDPGLQPMTPVATGPVAWRREQERSLWLHRHVAAALLLDPDAVLARARRNLDHLEQVHAGTIALQEVQQWRDLVEQGADAVHDVLVGLDPSACELRQSSPFAGVLEPDMRRQALQAFVEYWDDRAAVGGPVPR